MPSEDCGRAGWAWPGLGTAGSHAPGPRAGGRAKHNCPRALVTPTWVGRECPKLRSPCFVHRCDTPQPKHVAGTTNLEPLIVRFSTPLGSKVRRCQYCPGVGDRAGSEAQSVSTRGQPKPSGAGGQLSRKAGSTGGEAWQCTGRNLPDTDFRLQCLS